MPGGVNLNENSTRRKTFCLDRFSRTIPSLQIVGDDKEVCKQTDNALSEGQFSFAASFSMPDEKKESIFKSNRKKRIISISHNRSIFVVYMYQRYHNCLKSFYALQVQAITRSFTITIASESEYDSSLELVKANM